MATLAQLKTQVIAELNRDDMGSGGDLETVLANAIDRAIEYYADELFWFNRASATPNTVGGQNYIALPAGMRRADLITYSQQQLFKVNLEQIEYLTDTGIPTRWAADGNNIRLWPAPDAVYSLAVYGVADLGTPVTTNAWTTEALDLIDARVRFTLFRDILRDKDGAQFAKMAEEEALAGLNRESRRRRAVPARSADFTVARFNINKGW